MIPPFFPESTQTTTSRRQRCLDLSTIMRAIDSNDSSGGEMKVRSLMKRRRKRIRTTQRVCGSSGCLFMVVVSILSRQVTTAFYYSPEFFTAKKDSTIHSLLNSTARLNATNATIDELDTFNKNESQPDVLFSLPENTTKADSDVMKIDDDEIETESALDLDVEDDEFGNEEEDWEVKDDTDAPSRPMRTLQKLQRMLDDSDYKTTLDTGPTVYENDKSRNNVPRDRKDQLWTSSDRKKYKKQQREILRKIEQGRKKQQARAKKLDPPIIRVQRHTNDTEEASDDDSLSFTLPDLPVYMSDAEESDYEPEEVAAQHRRRKEQQHNSQPNQYHTRAPHQPSPEQNQPFQPLPTVPPPTLIPPDIEGRYMPPPPQSLYGYSAYGYGGYYPYPQAYYPPYANDPSMYQQYTSAMQQQQHQQFSPYQSQVPPPYNPYFNPYGPQQMPGYPSPYPQHESGNANAATKKNILPPWRSHPLVNSTGYPSTTSPHRVGPNSHKAQGTDISLQYTVGPYNTLYANHYQSELPLQSTLRLSFDSLQRIGLIMATVLLLCYSAVSPRTLPLSEYNLKFYENLRLVGLAAVFPAITMTSVFKVAENDINSVLNSFFTAFTVGYLVTFGAEVVAATLLRLAIFARLEPSIYSLSPNIPLITIPWVLRESGYRPKRITVLVADFVISCIACPIIEEYVKLKLLQWTTNLPSNFNWIIRPSSKNKRKKKIIAEVIPEGPQHKITISANQYVTHMLAISIGLKLCDAGRRILMYTKDSHHDKGFYAFVRGIFPAHELCGIVTALSLARRNLLGVYIPVWKMLLPSIIFHGTASFKGMKPIFKWNSATPWTEMQLAPLHISNPTSLPKIIQRSYGNIMKLLVIVRLLGSCIKNYYMINRRATRLKNFYTSNYSAFSAEMATTEALKTKKK